MVEEEKFTMQECHKKFAVDFFNLVWSLLDKKDRTKEEDDKMVHAVHASRFHWGEVGSAVNLARGEWQISRVYSVLNMPESALHHAKRCLEICKENIIGDFDLAFAYEAMARAYAVAREKSEVEKYIQLAKEAFTNNHEEKPDIPSVYDESEDFDAEIEDDALIGEDLFEEEWQ